jgi:hypothetical protein
MRRTHGEGARATPPMAIIGGEAHPVDPAIASPAALGPQQDLVPLEHGIRASVLIPSALDRLILHHPSYGEGDLVVVGIAHAPDCHRH